MKKWFLIILILGLTIYIAEGAGGRPARLQTMLEYLWKVQFGQPETTPADGVITTETRLRVDTDAAEDTLWLPAVDTESAQVINIANIGNNDLLVIVDDTGNEVINYSYVSDTFLTIQGQYDNATFWSYYNASDDLGWDIR